MKYWKITRTGVESELPVYAYGPNLQKAMEAVEEFTGPLEDRFRNVRVKGQQLASRDDVPEGMTIFGEPVPEFPAVDDAQ